MEDDNNINSPPPPSDVASSVVGTENNDSGVEDEEQILQNWHGADDDNDDDDNDDNDDNDDDDNNNDDRPICARCNQPILTDDDERTCDDCFRGPFHLYGCPTDDGYGIDSCPVCYEICEGSDDSVNSCIFCGAECDVCGSTHLCGYHHRKCDRCGMTVCQTTQPQDMLDAVHNHHGPDTVYEGCQCRCYSQFNAISAMERQLHPAIAFPRLAPMLYPKKQLKQVDKWRQLQESRGVARAIARQPREMDNVAYLRGYQRGLEQPMDRRTPMTARVPQPPAPRATTSSSSSSSSAVLRPTYDRHERRRELSGYPFQARFEQMRAVTHMNNLPFQVQSNIGGFLDPVLYGDAEMKQKRFADFAGRYTNEVYQMGVADGRERLPPRSNHEAYLRGYSEGSAMPQSYEARRLELQNLYDDQRRRGGYDDDDDDDMEEMDNN